MTESDSATSFHNAGSLHQELNQNRTALGCVVTPHLVSPSPPCGALFQGHDPYQILCVGPYKSILVLSQNVHAVQCLCPKQEFITEPAKPKMNTIYIYIYIYMGPARARRPPPPPMVWSQNLRFAAFRMKTLNLQCFLHGGWLARSANLQIRRISATSLPQTCSLQCFGFDIVE